MYYIYASFFQNVVFLVGMLVTFLLPDVQQSIKNDILHGKLEAYHFYNSRYWCIIVLVTPLL